MNLYVYNGSRNEGEESVRKKEEKFRTQTRTGRVESRTTTTYAFAVGAWAEAYPQQLPEGQRILSCVAETSLTLNRRSDVLNVT